MSLGAAYVVTGIAAAFVAGVVASGAFPSGSPGSPEMDHPSGHGADPHEADAASHIHGEGTEEVYLAPQGFNMGAPPDLSHTPPFPLEDGKRPTLDEAKAFARKYSRFVAKGDPGIEKLRAEGHLQGEGTRESPYVLERFYVDGELSLTSLHKPIILRDGYVKGQLRLNYIGDDVYVHHVYAKDLRVNENVQRNGTNTGGLFHDNHFAFVGQIRHFTGEFRHNTVGPRPADAVSEALGDGGVVKVAPAIVFNLDGFHGADVHHNEFAGQVDVKLHGHNHADCFTCPVHDHHDLADRGHEHHAVPENPYGFASVHSVRYTSLLLRENTVTVPSGVALRYNDLAHAGDDRTANSEPHPRLDDPHVHYQDVTIRANDLRGGSLVVEVFNAEDPNHPVQNFGILRIWDNQIQVDHPAQNAAQPRNPIVIGLQVGKADGLQLSALRNEILFREVRTGAPGEEVGGLLGPKTELRGIQLVSVEASNLTVAENAVAQGRYGLFAQSFAQSTHWWLRANQFQTEIAWRGQDVENPPKEE